MYRVKTDAIFGFLVPKNIENGHTRRLCTSNFFSCNAVLYVFVLKYMTTSEFPGICNPGGRSPRPRGGGSQRRRSLHVQTKNLYVSNNIAILTAWRHRWLTKVAHFSSRWLRWLRWLTREPPHLELFHTFSYFSYFFTFSYFFIIKDHVYGKSGFL